MQCSESSLHLFTLNCSSSILFVLSIALYSSRYCSELDAHYPRLTMARGKEHESDKDQKKKEGNNLGRLPCAGVSCRSGRGQFQCIRTRQRRENKTRERERGGKEKPAASRIIGQGVSIWVLSGNGQPRISSGVRNVNGVISGMHVFQKVACVFAFRKMRTVWNL